MIRRAAALLVVVLVACHAGDRGGGAPTNPDLLYAHGRDAFMRGDYNTAEAAAREGQTKFASQPRWRELFAVLEAECLARNHPAEAFDLLDRTPTTGAPLAAVRRLIARGYAFRTLRRWSDADATFYAADELAARAAPQLRNEIAMRRVLSQFAIGCADPAKLLAERTIERAIAANQTWVVANTYASLVYIETNRHEWAAARQHAIAGERYAQAAHAKPAETVLTANLAWAAMQLGDLEQAMSQYTSALKAHEEQGAFDQQHIALTHIADIYEMRAEPENALPYARRALDAARRIPNATAVANSLGQIAQLEIDLGRFTAAAAPNDEALALRLKQNDKVGELQSRINQARILAGTGDPAGALSILDRIISSPTVDAPYRWRAEGMEAKVYWQLGRLADAERMYEATLDTAADERQRTSVQGDVTVIAFERLLLRYYDEYIDLLLQQRRTIDALRVAERSRALTLRNAIGIKGQAQLDPRAVARAKNATILCYWLGGQRSLLWTITPRHVAVTILQPGDRIDAEADGYRAELQSPQHSLASTRGARLYALLVAPANVAPGSRVVILPDAHLNALSFETLIAPSPKPHYWIEDVTVSYAPSLQLLASEPSWTPPRDARLLVIGDVPAAGAEFPALARAGVEIAHVASHFDPSHREVLAGSKATCDAYVSSNPRRFSFVHFVAHGTATVRNPLESSVILAPSPNGFRLTGSQIVGAPLSAELVTVSSCNSAGRRSYTGEGLVGLAWAFLRAGARRVVAAQWDVSDSATPHVMDTMYERITAGDDPAVALRTAKLALLHSNSVYRRPFYWAPFVVYGAV